MTVFDIFFNDIKFQSIRILYNNNVIDFNGDTINSDTIISIFKQFGFNEQLITKYEKYTQQWRKDKVIDEMLKLLKEIIIVAELSDTTNYILFNMQSPQYRMLLSCIGKSDKPANIYYIQSVNSGAMVADDVRKDTENLENYILTQMLKILSLTKSSC